MFDLSAKDGSVRVRRPDDGPRDTQSATPGVTPAETLDSGDMVRRHHELVDTYIREMDRQRDNRMEQAEEADMYDNDMWSEDDARVLRDRGQEPLVYNVTSASIDWVTGTQRRTRTDFKVLPRRKADGKPAERKTELLKYLSDVNRTPFHVSRAFADAVKVGIGWMEDGIQDDSEDEPLYHRYASWRNVLWDSASSELDTEDGRYQFHSKFVDEDVLAAYFRSRRELIQRSASASEDFYGYDRFGDMPMDAQERAGETAGAGTSASADRLFGYQRRRVRTIEGWIKIPTEVVRLRGGHFDREIYDPYSRGHVEQLRAGNATTIKKTAMRVYLAIFTPVGLLYWGESPYRHNRFPYTPIWGKRRDRDGLPYGMMRLLKGLQVDVNKRATKSLAILSSNKTIMDEGAVEDLEEFAEEVSRPDAIIVKKKGFELKIDADRDLAQWHDTQMGRSISLIQSAAGVTDENLGRRTNAVSGIAIARRQDQGSLTTGLYFDNLWLAQQIRGEKQLANVEQFMSEEKAFRITNMRGAPSYVTVNDGLPENDIVRSKADFLISEADFRATQRQAAVEQLLETMSKLPPEVGIVFLDLAIEMMDLPNREEIVKRIRQVTGMRDPDAEEPTPEEQAKAEQAQQMDALKMQGLIAELRKLLAEAAVAEAKAEQTVAQTVGARIGATSQALAAAREALALPASAHVADHMLASAGYSGQPVPTGLGRAQLPAPPAGAMPAAPLPQPAAAMPAAAPMP